MSYYPGSGAICKNNLRNSSLRRQPPGETAGRLSLRRNRDHILRLIGAHQLRHAVWMLRSCVTVSLQDQFTAVLMSLHCAITFTSTPRSIACVIKCAAVTSFASTSVVAGPPKEILSAISAE